MKFYKSFIVLIFIGILIFSFRPIVFAVKLAPFDNGALQPIPVPDIQPNISKTTNYNPEQIKENLETYVSPSINLPVRESTIIKPVKIQKTDNFPKILIWSVVIIIIIGLTALAIPFLKSKK